MKKSMVICGNYGAGNIGDEAILRALVQKFELKYAITVISADPQATAKRFKVKAVPRFPGGIRSKLATWFIPSRQRGLKKTQKAVKECDVFLLGGGTLLTDTPLQSVIIWSKQVEPALKHGKKVWIYANGIGPLKHAFARELVGSLLERAERVSVRDLRSLEWTQRLGCRKARKVLDPEFQLKWRGGESTLKVDKNTIIFVPRFWRKNYNEAEKSFIKFIQYLCLEKGKNVIGISFNNESSKDDQFLNKIFEQAGVGNQAKIWKNYRDELDVIRAISRAEAVVGMRLHSLIFAEITQTPFVGISYMEKVSGLGETLKKMDCIVPLESLTPEALKDAYNASLKTDL